MENLPELTNPKEQKEAEELRLLSEHEIFWNQLAEDRDKMHEAIERKYKKELRRQSIWYYCIYIPAIIFLCGRLFLGSFRWPLFEFLGWCALMGVVLTWQGAAFFWRLYDFSGHKEHYEFNGKNFSSPFHTIAHGLLRIYLWLYAIVAFYCLYIA